MKRNRCHCRPMPVYARVCVCCMRFLWCSKWSITIAMFEENILWQTERKSRQTIGRQQQKWLSCNLRRLFFSSVSLSKQIKIIPRSKSTNQSVCLLFIITCCVHCNQEWDRDFGGSEKNQLQNYTRRTYYFISKSWRCVENISHWYALAPWCVSHAIVNENDTIIIVTFLYSNRWWFFFFIAFTYRHQIEPICCVYHD